ncbi:beta-galactosidase GalA [Flavitalea sp. BT771]|uniref:beta-galactosidase GalA n=1 Tax=Flavitalea sp. BT771 TaxID=3063329 RepID=UPI0026E1591F|nr:beta-galactosidase GalA [Flavitalea sp. BT771]MDO6430296.1 beta-galactosidase GalA [Flavitalea sp. BT771]MDV6219564.1 beta-galactosidase GalA [Flavitalea sp. BT771]
MKLPIIFFFVSIFSLSVAAQSTAAAGRDRACFDDGWQFHKGDIAIKRAVKAGQQGGLSDANVKVITGEEAVIAYTDKNKVAGYKPADWRDVSLPHDWCVEGTFVHDNTLGSQPAGNGYLPTGIGFYRKEFDVPESDKGKIITMTFDGIFRNSTVWVNGHLMGNHASGYTPSDYDLSDVLRYGGEGRNVILVKVDASDAEGWWYEGCGIYRHVWLNTTARLHVARYGTFITTPLVSKDSAVVSIRTILQNEDTVARHITLVSKIVDKKGRVVDSRSSELTIPPGDQPEVVQEGVVREPLLWSPETPDLYKMVTWVTADGSTIDDYSTSFGVRTVAITNEGFFLNGKLYPVKGTANHQDFAGVGVALPDKLNEYKIQLLKEMGCNGYRCAHNPPTPELLDACDRMGMLVLDENRLLSSGEDGMKDLATLIRRDRNHPSVFMWSMENEESLEGAPMGARILETLVKATHRLDPTRPATAAMNHGWNDGGYSDVLDVVGYNYGQRGMQYVKDHEKYPRRRMFVTESTSYVSTRGEYEDNKEKGYVSNFGLGVGWGLQPGQDWKHIVQYPFLGGTFVWTGFDYRGEPTPYQWPCVSSHFGIMDLCGFPKDGYYAYKAAWTNTPVVHVFPHWSWPGREGQKIKMRGYTNCEEVELLVNGKRIGKKRAAPFEYLEWEVIYQPGKLEARGYKSGKVVARQLVETTTAPARVSLSGDCTKLKADGSDVAVVNVAIKDAMGRVAPTAGNLVTFSIEGPGRIIGTGNGNPSSHEPDKAMQRTAFNGYCQVLVQSDKADGEIRLSAASAGLKGAEIMLTVSSQTNLYVSPKGSDANPGTSTSPFASIGTALSAARKISGPVTIKLFAGTYYVSHPVVFTSADSRKAGEPLTLTGAGDGEVIISGAAPLGNLHWSKYKNGIWQAHVSQDLVFDELIVNGQLQRMARYPNFDPSARFLGGTAADAISAQRAARWHSPEGGYVHALHRSEWGDFHYVITGINDTGGLILQGGWQNNRRMGMHERYRYVENIFEELDTANEWFYDKTSKTLYYYPPSGLDPTTAKFGTPQPAHLFELSGTEEDPVKNITISGVTLTGAVRSFMQNREPLLRSDWTIYRGGAVVFSGAVNCHLTGCRLHDLGGNGVFFDKFNRDCSVAHCQISAIGASAICFVGDPGAVRSPSFEYNEFTPLDRIDRTPGPKSNNYPADCRVYDCLLFVLGQVEKQSAGVELSMCRNITVSHNSIYDVPRAGINVSEGTWGGHLIEYNDVFNTVKESGDHGSFNSWGRDRYWHPDKQKLDSIVADHFDLALLDVVKPIVLRNNRMRCDHGWDIDLDDGSGNYEIYNNLCLNGGIKLREGVHRVVENNIMVNNTFHPHVWFKNSGDIFRHNVVSAGYKPIGIPVWGKEVDYNLFPDSASLKEAWARGTDRHSVCGPLEFADPAKGDFRLKDGSSAFSVGFRNFSMDSFGVVSPKLKAIARRPAFPEVGVITESGEVKVIDFMGARVKDLKTLGERSATGMDDTRGVLVVNVAPGAAATGVLRPNDVILSFNSRQIDNLKDLLEARQSVSGPATEIIVLRDQKPLKQKIELKIR